jgi:transglutaminase-like putative cysteine protease
VLTPSQGWVDLDPTNDQVADSRYIVTAWGRDFTDVSPLRGIVYTEAGQSDLSVAVDVVPLP